MVALYNEIDPFAADWLSNLITAGHIAPGTVDRRSIADVRATDLVGATQAHFFAGIGAWSYALRLARWPDDRPVWTGSCPCQPFSNAGKGEGFNDPRHLWPQLFRLIRECRPPVCFGEQVSGKDGERWLDLVYTDMEAIGYAVGAAVLPAAGVGAPHGRHRIYWVAQRLEHSNGSGLAERPGRSFGRRDVRQEGATVGEAGLKGSSWRPPRWLLCSDDTHRPTEPSTHPLAYGFAGRLGPMQPGDQRLRSLAHANRRGRIHAHGNAIVPQVAATFIRAFMDVTS